MRTYVASQSQQGGHQRFQNIVAKDVAGRGQRHKSRQDDKVVNQSKHTAPRAYAILFAAQLAIGSAAIFARFALEGARPIAVSALRLSIAGFPLLIYSLCRHPEKLARLCGIVFGGPLRHLDWLAAVHIGRGLNIARFYQPAVDRTI
jgi:hypothetical protein